MALAWEHIEATRLGYEVESSRRQEQSLQSSIGSLKMRLETNVSCGRLTQAAKRIGMLPAPPAALRVLDSLPDINSKQSAWSRISAKLSQVFSPSV